MSLLDQLSSLCIQSTATNYQPSFFSFNLDQTSSILLPPSRTQSAQKRNPEPQSQKKHHQIHNSQQKMIKLFDDEELKPSWKLIKTQKKPDSHPTGENNELSQFTVDNPKKDNQAILIKFTKIFYLFNTKLRKMNYQFFVKLEKYSKFIAKEQTENQQKIAKMKMLTIQKGFHKLTQTLKIINLKYFQSETQQLSSQNAHDSKNKVFMKIKSNHLIGKKLSFIEKFVTKNLSRNFFTKFQLQNKNGIKIDLFTSLLDSILKQKCKENFEIFFSSLREENEFKKQAILKTADWIQRDFSEKGSNNFIPVFHQQIFTNFSVNLTETFPLRFFLQKSVNVSLSEEVQLNFDSLGHQNVPLKLHNLKSHQQQTNLNDCIDNGHLLMNQLKNNMSFRQDLENLTISNINSKTSNTSINSSLLAYENLILPQQNNQEKEEFISYRAVTMRKQSRQSDDIPVTNETLIKESKKSRKSLVITKRKDSTNDMLSYAQVMVNSQKQKLAIDAKKPKSTTTSTQKIAGQKHPSNSDKEVIKRMLDELNKKFACDDKVIKISLSNKKQNSNAKKEKSESSGKNFERKKIRSQITPVTNFNEKSNKKDSEKKLAQKESYRIDLTDKCQENQKIFFQDNKKKNKTKGSENCFMSVTLNKTVNNPQSQLKAEIDYGKMAEQRTKQSHSEMSKKNLNGKCTVQSSQQKDICKILSKYRSKKPSIPECCMKIDLVTSKVNKVLSMAQKCNKERNKIFLNNNQSLDETEDYKFQLGSNDSIVGPNLEVSKTYSRPSNDTFMIKRNSMNHLSSQTDSFIGECMSMLPSNIYIHENQEENDCLPYSSQKPQAINTSLDASECFFTGSNARLSSKPNSMNSSMDKKRASFERNLEEWDIMFEKQKSKFLKNESKAPKKKSSLNEEVITEIKQKIQQCLILNQKDTNASKGPYLQLKKTTSQNSNLEEKNAIMSSNNTVKMLSSSNNNRNSINRLSTTNKLTKRIEN